MSGLFSAFNSITTRSARKRKPCLLALPNDTLVDRLFPLLDVEDIIRLRSVCKRLYHLTHHGIIWKRLLRQTDLPIPPLPPTGRHCLKNLSSFEAERLLVRAESLWKSIHWANPEPSDIWGFNAYHRVKHMVMLPGSQYMVASVCEMSGTGWSLVVYIMDGRYNVVPVAKMPTGTKAFGLKAKYLTIKGVAGITVAYIRRAWVHRGDANKGININDYSGDHEVDPPYPVKYECHAVHIPLEKLEEICDPRLIPGSEEFIEHARLLPPPFHRLCFIRSSRPLGNISLDILRGKPTISLIKYPCTLMFKPLDGAPASILNIGNFPTYNRYPHRIIAFRPLPYQNQVLLVRSVDAPPRPSRNGVASLEIYPIPNNLTSEQMEVNYFPSDFCLLHEDKVSHAWITEQGTPNWFEENPDAENAVVKEDPAWKPFPIHVYFKAVAPNEGLSRATFYPKEVPDWRPPSPASSPSSSPKSKRGTLVERHTYKYSFDHVSPVRFVQAISHTQFRLLPGTHRSLVYTIPLGDMRECPRVLEFFRYYDKEQYADEAEEIVDGQQRKPLHNTGLHTMVKFEEGARAFAWDDHIGRLMYTVEGKSKVYVIDYSKRPKEDLYGKRMPLAVEQDHDIDSDDLNFDSESEMDGGMYEEAAYTQDLVDSAYDLLGEDEDDRS